VSGSEHLQRGTCLETGGGRRVLVEGWKDQGSYSNVYRGMLNGMPCAVKVPKRELAESAELVAREGETLARVSSPAVVRVFDTGTLDGRPYLVLQWIEGERLLDLLQARRSLPLRQALELLERLAEGLAAFHAQGLTHGDVRSENVLVPSTAQAVLIDPHGMPVGRAANGGTGGPEGDLRAAADLLHRVLTGEDPGEAPRLTGGAGYNRGTVALYDQLRAGRANAAGFLAETRRLRSAL
jgi:eukaryotic-like serine/threonine-protein kinase